MISRRPGARRASFAPDFRHRQASYRLGARIVPTPITGWRKGSYMKRRPMSWRIGALSSVVALVVVALGAAAGQSALRGAFGDARSSTGRRIRSRTSIRRVRTTTERRRSMGNVYEHLLDFRHGPKLEPSLATKCFSVGSLATWRCNLRRGVTFSDGSAFDSTDVKFSFDRVSEPDDREGGGRELAVLVARKHEERHDEREVRSDVPSQVTPGHVAVHSRDAGGIHRALGHV